MYSVVLKTNPNIKTDTCEGEEGGRKTHIISSQPVADHLSYQATCDDIQNKPNTININNCGLTEKGEGHETTEQVYFLSQTNLLEFLQALTDVQSQIDQYTISGALQECEENNTVTL